MNGKKEDILMLVFVASFLVAVFFLCTGRSAVHDIRKRAEPIRAELNNAREAQQREAETIGRASEAAGRSTAAISDSQRAVAEIKRMERDDIAIIAESRSIIEAIRERGIAQD